MTIDLNKGWFFCKEDGIPVETDLPHDAMLAETRDMPSPILPAVWTRYCGSCPGPG